MSETILDREVQDARAARVHEVEQGERVSITVGFDKEALSQLDLEALVGKGWDGEGKVTRLRGVIDTYSRLPEEMHFEAGITAIFGENGAGKTLLADIIIMATQMELHRQKNGQQFGERILGDYKGEKDKFYPTLPGRLGSGRETIGEEDHTALVAELAQCMRVHDAALMSLTEFGLSSAMRSPAALGNIAMGMSSRQAVDYLKGMQGRSDRGNNPSVMLYDEPELGMSPRRQMGLVDELLKNRSGAVELVPSNSIVLFESNIPRIDLDTPEKGIHTPADEQSLELVS